eukprot:CAMPEP_0169275534 /NCGR_PEP_ID=MMETSP1016-20121227/52441_1 /TAXON_ID=342587 /ORGANISM="Karlodinium micrum, Strain CCMP2283" /LENGTH=50 /DNA_ID=CAMNT_0009362431 /DNA_START=100 /DNA_END=252 /DNA_ORIENTATION=+
MDDRTADVCAWPCVRRPTLPKEATKNERCYIHQKVRLLMPKHILALLLHP